MGNNVFCESALGKRADGFAKELYGFLSTWTLQPIKPEGRRGDAQMRGLPLVEASGAVFDVARGDAQGGRVGDMSDRRSPPRK